MAVMPLLLLIFLAGVSSVFALTVDSLRCEFRVNPIGVDATQPRLSWVPGSTQRGESVSAYRILVASSSAVLALDQGDLWDSGQVTSGENANVAYAGTALSSLQQVFWKVRLWNGGGTASDWSATASWTMGLLTTWSAQWIGFGTADAGSTQLRRTFTTSASVKRAVICICGLGEYELSVNGTRVGQDRHSPGWTKYDKTCLYDTYDITSLVQSSASNALGVFLGNGMYNVPTTSGRYSKFTGSFGARKVIAQLRIEYQNGTTQTVVTDTAWKARSGPITFNTVFGGEDYDARNERTGWDTASFNATSWSAAAATTGPGGTLRGLSSAAPPLRKQDVFSPSPAIAPTTSRVYDFGQNATQIPKIVVHGARGDTVKLTPSELGNISGTGTVSPLVSPVYWLYTLKGSTAAAPETYEPRFCYSGYRFLKVEFTGTATLDGLTSTVLHTSSDAVGSFSTSNDLFNRTRTLIRWAQRSNLVSVLTDCPHREKLGWLEQYHLHGPSLRYEFDLAAMFSKTYVDMADSQGTNGFVPTTAPEYSVFGGNFRDSPEWSSSFVLSPEQNFDFYGEMQSATRHYANIKRYVDYLGTRASGYILNYGLGDWYDLGPGALGQAQLTPVSLTATAMYFADAKALAQMATRLGNTADAATYNALAANIRSAFNALHYNPASGSYATNSQTSNALPLAFNLVEDANRAKVVDALVASVRATGNRVTAGDVGHRYLLRALADAGRSDVIFDLHSRSDAPGYGYILNQGATALTEGWDGSASQNHFMLGHIMEWFYHDLAGIQSDPAGPGFQKIIIKPAMVGDITWTNASYRSIRGNIVSNWTHTGSGLTMNVTIPPGATARVYVPAANPAAVLESGLPASSAPGVTYTGTENGAAVFAVGSGTYAFSSSDLPIAPISLTAMAGTGQVTLSWTASANAATYTVQRSLNGGVFATLASNLTTPGYVDTGLTKGATCYYIVTAVNPLGQASATTTATLSFAGDPGFETPVTTTYAYNPAGGGWTYSGTPGNGSGVTANASAFTSGNPSAPQGTQVAFIQGVATISQTVAGLTPGTTYSVTFAWAQRGNQNAGGQTWQLKRDGTVIGTYAPDQTTSYTDATATFTATATSHILSFAGTNTRTGDNTVFLDNVRVATAAPPPPPTSVTATAGNAVVTLEWTSVPWATSYNIVRSSGGGNYLPVATGLSSLSWLDTGASNGTIYSYQVVSVSAAGSGSPSTAVSAQPFSPPIQPDEQIPPQMILSPDRTIATFKLKTSVLGHAYELQFSDDLTPNSWAPVAGFAPLPGTGGALQIDVPLDQLAARRFFRVLITRF
jgi:hypothetical protein